ncbi:Dabb family protein [Microbacterium sp. W1N]|uniref:Dabb family protein n=1 Tax=Microbacterium festucae TaxID=2977531 RepID=UPI0021C16FC0|nr:Dabb family protein [Microbacterium festucae]MCT9821234.1 Dabb family protein [Microbacterium festucae]
MAIQHTVVFRLIHPDGSAEAEAFLRDGREALTAIPGVGDFEIRRQVSPKSTLTHQFSMTFADETAYQAYNEHPAHVGFVRTRWVPEVAEFQELDFVAL